MITRILLSISKGLSNNKDLLLELIKKNNSKKAVNSRINIKVYEKSIYFKHMSNFLTNFWFKGYTKSPFL